LFNAALREAIPDIQDARIEIIPTLLRPSGPTRPPMLYYSLIFLLVAIVAGVLGFGVVAGTAATIAKVLFVVFLVLMIVSLLRSRRA
jgi:uncharacterized membrane protein YtjA (UPF0391 family)